MHHSASAMHADASRTSPINRLHPPQTPTPDPNPDPYQVRRVEYGWHTEFPDTLDALEVSK